MQNLLDTYYKLLTNKRQDGSYLASVVEKSPGIRIAVDDHKHIAFLIPQSGISEENIQNKDLGLKYLEVLFNRECAVTDLGNKSIYTDTYIIISLKSNELNRVEYFLSIIVLMLARLYTNFSFQQIKEEIKFLVELFSKSESLSFQKIIGIWGELFFITCQKNIENAISGWHLKSTERFDFKFNNGIYEVKTTVQPSRIHEFNNNQLSSYLNFEVNIISIQTVQDESGISIYDLWQKLDGLINSTEVKNKLAGVISETIGGDFKALKQIKFNDKLAGKTIANFKSSELPNIEQNALHKSIIGVHLTINLDLV